MKARPWVTPYGGRVPRLHPEAFVDVSARIIGAVELARGCSVWPMAVLRADAAEISLGERSAVLDLALVEAPEGRPVIIGEEAIVSHGAMIHGARIEARALVGIGAVILDGAVIGRGSLIGAGSLVTPETVIPPESLVLGSPGKVVRSTRPEERRTMLAQVEELYRKSRVYMAD